MQIENLKQRIANLMKVATELNDEIQMPKEQHDALKSSMEDIDDFDEFPRDYTTIHFSTKQSCLRSSTAHIHHAAHTSPP
jgi:hypothetical protein